ncbi:hypothetical protein PoB_006431800 [Plakobranchus ocellatus]|uniref:Uncharacterized protein n=1 Tax=Plakobranchus ocellatus TaxID=259542 RepID=A0AAV4D0U8_9GAST|nr:hypothetical protein PoB_006431800 [Plakobranchus ocellatus]
MVIDPSPAVPDYFCKEYAPRYRPWCHKVLPRIGFEAIYHSMLQCAGEAETTPKDRTVVEHASDQLQSKAKGEFNFSLVPFTQVRQLQMDQTAGIHSVRYKLSHQPHSDWTTVSVRKEVRPTTTRKSTVTKRSSVPEIPLKPLKKPCLATEKKKDLTSMLPYMPESDKAYMQSVLMN